MINIYEAVAANNRKSVVVIIGFMVFATLAVYFISQAIGVYVGYEPGGLGLAGAALIISGLISFGGYWFSDKIVLGISGARPADKSRDYLFFTVAENLAIGTGLPTPKLYVIQDTAPNAFATGRDSKHAVICATTGLLQKLDRTQLEGVIAHELSHIRHYDMRLMSIVVVLVGTVALLGDWFLRMSWYGRRSDSDRKSDQMGAIILIVGLVFAVLSPIIAQLIQLAISRRREFLADAGAISITRQPEGLISALRKISADHEPLEAANKATAHLYIINPFKSDSPQASRPEHRRGVDWFSGLFNTHPPVAERITALRRMS
ncbi:zinc metalloprotease HtpX [Candidatus Woesebacteria bacterium GWB1_43_5]|uniref:Protease HtpX homolog n=1 Tax=Candidatus Woesebacteria bacterium GWB1_43_5 TaxID=1802474 RepID=A0A1F7WRU3_9BACT|nr:MAG: zinc metalloprotease HtpX [Candidatus Woesebacteria bacterium GWB1_43_5]